MLSELNTEEHHNFVYVRLKKNGCITSIVQLRISLWIGTTLTNFSEDGNTPERKEWVKVSVSGLEISYSSKE